MDLNDFLYRLLNSGQAPHPGVGGGMPGTVAPQMAQPAPQMPAQAPQGQPMPQSAPQPAPAANGGGFGDLLSNIFAPKQAGRNQTVAYLQSQGLDPGAATILASDKTALRSYLLKGGQKSDFDQRAAAAKQYGLDLSTPEGRKFILTGQLDGGSGDQTSDMKEYDAAVKQGFKGTLMDFMVKMKEAGRNQLNIETGTKLPAGYMWIDPNDQKQGVMPIPGGPSTQIPAEAAGRIGLADTFLNNFDAIRQKVAAGEITGPLDAFRVRNDSQYGGAETFRQIQSGVDALQRMLTGAGMPASEAANYAYRYLPGYTDDAQSMAGKLDRLKSELESVKTRVLQGRGGLPAQAAQPQGGRTIKSIRDLSDAELEAIINGQ